MSNSMKNSTSLKNTSAALCGIIFGAGLAISGMTDTQKVIGFLDIFGNWVPDLAFVMGSAVLVTLVGFRLVFKKQAPLFDAQFHLPSTTIIDAKLILGALIFGIGWGLYGYCPGPAIASLAYFDGRSLIFIASMLTGMFIYHLLENSNTKSH